MGVKFFACRDPPRGKTLLGEGGFSFSGLEKGGVWKAKRSTTDEGVPQGKGAKFKTSPLRRAVKKKTFALGREGKRKGQREECVSMTRGGAHVGVGRRDSDSGIPGEGSSFDVKGGRRRGGEVNL